MSSTVEACQQLVKNLVIFRFKNFNASLRYLQRVLDAEKGRDGVSAGKTKPKNVVE
jgi:hypothetical protein